MSARYFKSLLFRLTQIQHEIEKEHTRRLPNWMRLLKLKKLRLVLKDRLARLVHSGSDLRLQPVRIDSRPRRYKLVRAYQQNS